MNDDEQVGAVWDSEMRQENRGKEIQHWADNAMFPAEPLNKDDGPKVYLLSMTPDPLGTIAAVNKMYVGQTIRNLHDIDDEERRKHWQEVSKTRLKAPFEFVQFHFMIEGVTRAFTHQMVRQRTATFAQESLRFAVKEDLSDSVSLPPSIAGTPHWSDPAIMQTTQTYRRLTKEERQRIQWDAAVEKIQRTYQNLVDDGMPAEDARGLLPTNTLTRLHYRTNLRDLLEHSGMRLCTQAQFEWRLVWAQMLKAIREYTWRPDGRGTKLGVRHEDTWQYEEIAKLFKPICYQTGKCEFMSAYDRACSIRNRVQANHEIGRPSEQWGKELDNVHEFAGDPIVAGVGPHSVVRESEGGKPVFIGAISPVEWIADPTAARHNKGGHIGETS